HCIPHGCAATGIDSCEGLFEFFDVVGEIFIVRVIEEGLVVEVYNEYFVVLVRILDQRQRSSFDLGTLITHAAAIVDNQAERDWHVLASKRANRLLDAVLENRKSGLREIRYQVPALIQYSRMEHDKTRIRRERSKLVLLLSRRLLGLLPAQGVNG